MNINADIVRNGTKSPDELQVELVGSTYGIEACGVGWRLGKRAGAWGWGGEGVGGLGREGG